MHRSTPHRSTPQLSCTLAFAALLAGGLAAGPAAAQDGQQEIETFETPVVGSDGEEIGLLVLRGGPNGVVARLTIDQDQLSTGWHAAHFHRVGDCSDAPEFKASEGHITSEGAMHGHLHPEGPEAGDLANFYAGEGGAAVAEFATTLVTFDGDPALFDDDGSALVVHEAPDDHVTQPIGGAGGRVACAVIERTQ
ncbi:superoxide dismutase family protein [Salinarimonas rosea]|uniref:superoxide dismutase family protein n=1 Tax=Salinarimonas rosea TaxID=552063 RepID=UPI0004293954|nr:superoxide dismutase family protein [Salinarimonas rosea]